MNLYERAYEFLDSSIVLVQPYSELEALNKELKEFKNRLNEPLRVAIVGIIKAGKSTLMNALLGEKLLITGNIETTYRPTWFKYSERPELIIHLKNKGAKKAQINDLALWTERNKKELNPEMDEVNYVEVRYNKDILKDMEFIDTPGLKSSHVSDSDSTLTLLGIDVNEADELTKKEASQADAIVYAFSKGISQSDHDLLDVFEGQLPANTSPINAFGVLTKVDNYWSSGSEDPIKSAQKITERLQNDIRIISKLYAILPVSGKISEGLSGMGEKEKQTLNKLSKVNPERIENILKNAERFSKKAYNDISVPPEDREPLWDLLGQYGIHLALTEMRNGRNINELRGYFDEKSGISSLTRIIKQHFGNRSFLIKLRNILFRAKGQCFNIINNSGRSNPNLVRILENIQDECEGIEANEHAFRELEILQHYYNGELKLDESETKELLEITGEYGSNCEARLGVELGTSVRELAIISREKAQKWNQKANSYGIRSKYYEPAARTLTRSCEIMYHYLSYLAGHKI